MAIAATRRLPVTAVASALAVTAMVQRTTTCAGWPSFMRALVKLPAKLPIAAAAPINPRMRSCSQPLASCDLA